MQLWHYVAEPQCIRLRSTLMTGRHAIRSGTHAVALGGESGGIVAWERTMADVLSTGVRLWVKRYNGPGNDWDDATALELDAEANVYVTGYSARVDSSEDYFTIKYSQGSPFAEILVDPRCLDTGKAKSGDLGTILVFSELTTQTGKCKYIHCPP